MAIIDNIPMEEIEITTWPEFGEALRRVDQLRHIRKEKSGGRPLHPTIFRGQGNSQWSLQTTLERSFPMECSEDNVSFVQYYAKISASRPMIETMAGKEWEGVPDWPTFQKLLNENAERWLDKHLGDNLAIYKYLIYLRHHHFPSPLLDWTASPYVAALFAFDSMDKDVESVAIYAFSQDTLHSASSDEHFFIVGPYLATHARHYLQQSRYSLCVGLQVESHSKYRRIDYRFVPHEEALNRSSNRNTDVAVKLKVRANQRKLALQDLDLMNINPYSLFGSEESLIRTVARRECLFKNWRL